MWWTKYSVWFAIGLLIACNEFGLDPIDPTDILPQYADVDEVFLQEPLPAVDLLFVVDNTPSMAQEQVALADEFTMLVEGLSEYGIAWQVGVVTMDRLDEYAGWLVGDPWVLSPSTPSAGEIFAETMQLGTDDGGAEAGLASAMLALDLAEGGGVNSGFRRGDAALHVVFFSDGDDQSDQWLSKDPVHVFYQALLWEEQRTGLPATVSAVVGDVPSGCVSEYGEAQAAHRYVDLVELAGGITTSICHGDFALLMSTIGNASVSYPSWFLLREVPVMDSIHVEVNGVLLDTGWWVNDGQQILYFETPPIPEAIIEVSYLVAISE